MKTVNRSEARSRLSKLVRSSEAGEEIVIARRGKPAARLVALAAPPARKPGGWEGRIWVAPDLDHVDMTIAALMFDDLCTE